MSDRVKEARGAVGTERGGEARAGAADGAAPAAGAEQQQQRKYDWSGVTEDWPRDSVVDHLLLVVHGIGTNDETLPSYVDTLRQTFEPSWQRKYLDIPLAVAVDAISWHTMARAPQETMEKITLPTVPAVRSVMNDTIIDVLYYRSPHYGQRLINAVAQLLNSKVALYKKRFPKFSGHVSLFCHSLGSVIMFDLLQKQRQPGDRPDLNRPTVLQPPRADDARGIGTHSDEDWVWPQLEFEVQHMFGLGSPISIFLTTRGDVYKDSWPREAKGFAFPGGARFFNIFDPTDPVAFRFEPLINPSYSRLPPAVVPSRHKRTISPLLEQQPRATRADFFGWQRIDFALQEAGVSSGLMGHLRAISQAHYCYWTSKDLAIFVLDAILHQKLYADPSLEMSLRDIEHHGMRGPRGDRGQAASPPNRGVGGAWEGGHGCEGREGQEGQDDAGRQRAAGEGEHETWWAEQVIAIKEQVMWLLTSDLLAAEVPPIVGSRTAAPGGAFTYALGNLRVSSIDVPRHKVVVVCSRQGSITVKATDISAHLKGFTWLYKQKGPPHLKDSGTADATLQGISLWLGMNRDQLNSGIARNSAPPPAQRRAGTSAAAAAAAANGRERGAATDAEPSGVHGGGGGGLECLLCDTQPEDSGEGAGGRWVAEGERVAEGEQGERAATTHANGGGERGEEMACSAETRAGGGAAGGGGLAARRGGDGAVAHDGGRDAGGEQVGVGAAKADGEGEGEGVGWEEEGDRAPAVDVRIKIRSLDVQLHKSGALTLLGFRCRGDKSPGTRAVR